MLKNGPLEDRLKARIEHDQKALEDQTRTALKLHEDTLKKLSNAALSTTRSVIESQIRFLAQALGQARAQAEQEANRLPRLLLLSMIWPVAATALICLLLIGITWLWLPTELFQAQTTTWALDGGRTATVITAPDWTVCYQGETPFPCKIHLPSR